jgi:hypothetical protein
MNKKFRSEEDVRAFLEKKEKAPIPDIIWDKLVEKGYVQEVLDGYDDAMSYLIKEYKSLKEVHDTGAKSGVRVYDASKLFIPKETPSFTEEDLIYSKVIAYEIGNLPFLKDFRRKYLNNQLIPIEKIDGWIKEMAKKDGQSTINAKRKISKIEIKSNGEIVHCFDENSRWQFEGPVLLQYPSSSGWTEYVPINMEGVLGCLKTVAERLIKHYCPMWQEGQAVAFILTGLVPLIPKIRSTVTLNSMGICFITLKFDARLTPQELAKQYGKLRKKILGSKIVKPLSKKHLKLAEFVVDNKKEGITWEKLMHLWNEKYPEWAYKNYRLFYRDGNAAIKRIMAGKIDYESFFANMTISQ